MTVGLDYTAPCPGCEKPIGGHTIEGYGACLQAAGFDYHLPFEDVPDGPVRFPNVDGDLVGEVTVMAAVVETALGRLPLLRFVFTGAGDRPMERRNLPAINLVMDDAGLRRLPGLVSAAVNRAVNAAKTGR